MLEPKEAPSMGTSEKTDVDRGRGPVDVAVDIKVLSSPSAGFGLRGRV